MGRSGEPVSVKTLNSLFLMIKKVLDQAVQLEGGHLSHFEVTSLFAYTTEFMVVCSKKYKYLEGELRKFIGVREI